MATYPLNQVNQPYIQFYAEKIETLNEHGVLDVIYNVLGVEFVSDPYGEPYQEPVYLASVTKKGDCEDISILAANLIKAKCPDCDVYVVYSVSEDWKIGHIWVEVFSDDGVWSVLKYDECSEEIGRWELR